MQWKDFEMRPKNNFTSKYDAPVAVTCPLINLAVAPSTVETSTYLPIPINCIMLSAWKENQTSMGVGVCVRARAIDSEMCTDKTWMPMAKHLKNH
jgi:hypothetical protein